MILKMLTHIHMVVYTWWCWHIYKGGGVCRGEMGFDSALSGKWNAYFLLRRMQILGGWHIGARVEKIEVRTELMPASVQ